MWEHSDARKHLRGHFTDGNVSVQKFESHRSVFRQLVDKETMTTLLVFFSVL